MARLTVHSLNLHCIFSVIEKKAIERSGVKMRGAGAGKDELCTAINKGFQ